MVSQLNIVSNGICKRRSTAVLLATYNGAKFLDEQLASLNAQTVASLDIWASDDGSRDETLQILQAWKHRWSKGSFQILDGPKGGFAENFRHLIRSVNHDYDAYFFSDQDDIWLENKICRAFAVTQNQLRHPVLYGARTQLINEAGKRIGLSPLFSRPMSFSNALVQSMAGGNTMMLNRPAFELLAESARRVTFPTHDWWAYIIVTACGGRAVYDPEPTLLYRQHETNVVGRNSGFVATARRIRGVANGQFRSWATSNIEALDACYDMIAPDAQNTLRRWKAVHNAHPPFGLFELTRSGIYRQNIRGNLMLHLACILGWV